MALARMEEEALFEKRLHQLSWPNMLLTFLPFPPFVVATEEEDGRGRRKGLLLSFPGHHCIMQKNQQKGEKI